MEEKLLNEQLSKMQTKTAVGVYRPKGASGKIAEMMKGERTKVGSLVVEEKKKKEKKVVVEEEVVKIETKEEIEKKIFKLNKILFDIEQIKINGPKNEDQQKKMEREAAIKQEIEALKTKL